MRLTTKLAALVATLVAVPMLMAPSGNPPPTPAVLTCVNSTTCSATGLRIGQAICVTSDTANSRASTTTQTADPNLRIQNVPVGHYWLEFSFMTQEGAGGLNWTNSFGWAQAGVANIEAAGHGTTSGAFNGGYASNAIGWHLVNGFTTDANLVVSGQGSIAYTSTADVNINWAQNTSNATNTTVQGGSICLLRLN